MKQLVAGLTVAVVSVAGAAPKTRKAVAPAKLPGATSIAVGAHHKCAVLADSQVACWGSNSAGQLGDGTTENRAEPTLVEKLPGKATQVVAGDGHTCALLDDRRVACWGTNGDGQLGTPGEPTTTPRVVTRVRDALKLASDESGTCAMTRAGGLWCWGMTPFTDRGTDGQPIEIPNNLPRSDVSIGEGRGCTIVDGGARCLGYQITMADSTAITERREAPKLPAIAVAATSDHICLLTPQGDLMCWGDPMSYVPASEIQSRLGARATRTPEKISLGDGKLAAIAVASGKTCAIDRRRQLWCAGLTRHGLERHQDRIDLDTEVKAVALGASHGCALLIDGRVSCWGLNGDDYAPPRIVPQIGALSSGK